MALILNIETTSNICSVALGKDAELLSLKESSLPNTHASQITLFIEEIMKEKNISLNDLDAVAVSRGPGSYTGLRIGVSTAKGLCYALGKPLISVDTLQTLAWAAIQKNKIENAIYCPLIDARRMEVFTGLFDHNGEAVEAASAKIVDENFCKKQMEKRKVVFFGNALQKVHSVIQNENAVFLEGIDCSAKNMLSYSEKKYQSKEFEDVAYFEPFYLKPFVSNKSVH